MAFLPLFIVNYLDFISSNKDLISRVKCIGNDFSKWVLTFKNFLSEYSNFVDTMLKRKSDFTSVDLNTGLISYKSQYRQIVSDLHSIIFDLESLLDIFYIPKDKVYFLKSIIRVLELYKNYIEMLESTVITNINLLGAKESLQHLTFTTTDLKTFQSFHMNLYKSSYCVPLEQLIRLSLDYINSNLENPYDLKYKDFNAYIKSLTFRYESNPSDTYIFTDEVLKNIFDLLSLQGEYTLSNIHCSTTNTLS